ncbi:hypothetical protein RchiOBHm_Chr7g0183441 [Rosa chinensis]|uniref:COBRA C-terminal domain-containing protein n=1 Tax=Rosa chinensis TaxID=74649 RepID=A0A2P6P355_ROSCH|nr:hypothetical protein RchiOBHm_Chr7g0183441 [Rosa chinensis]
MNYSQWTLAAQHPNLNKLANVSGFLYRPLNNYGSINDTGMFYGIKYVNDPQMEAGPHGYVYTELILKKEKRTFTLEHGWAFPLKIYLSGDECMMLLPDIYPHLPNFACLEANPISIHLLHLIPLRGVCYMGLDILISLCYTNPMFGNNHDYFK